MNLFAEFSARIVDMVQALGLKTASGEPLDMARVAVELPRDVNHGDLATNAAMVLSKAVGTNPRQLGEQLAAELAKDPDVSEVSVAGPGFVNIRLADGFWQARLRDMLTAGTDYGRSKAGAGRKINVEYVSANPTGPMHVGHCRGAVVGDALANLLAFAGSEVTKEYYINDAGAQIGVLAQSAFLRYREALGEDIGDIPAGLYPGDYLVPVGQTLADRFGRALLEK
ncbi:MAG TPA: arginine--tRNA ligase, partial [Tianweitania sediminis]|nr:arginine--tRNA ligase [Tianweitania sediminis]